MRTQHNNEHLPPVQAGRLHRRQGAGNRLWVMNGRRSIAGIDDEGRHKTFHQPLAGALFQRLPSETSGNRPQAEGYRHQVTGRERAANRRGPPGEMRSAGILPALKNAARVAARIAINVRMRKRHIGGRRFAVVRCLTSRAGKSPSTIRGSVGLFPGAARGLAQGKPEPDRMLKSAFNECPSERTEESRHWLSKRCRGLSPHSARQTGSFRSL